MDDYEERLQKLGTTIARCREREGLSQKTMSHMLGFNSHSRLSRIENGREAPSMQNLFDLADILGVEVKYFFTDL